MRPIEIIAVISAILILLKTLMFLINPKKALKIREDILNKTVLLTGMYAVLLIVVGYFVITEISIVNTFAGLIFGILLMGLSLVIYPKAMINLVKAIAKDRKKLILPMIVWVVLSIWVLYAVFG